MKKIINIVLIVLALSFLVVVSLMSSSNPEIIDEQINVATLIATPISSIETEESVDINNLPHVDNMDLYQYDDPGSIVYMYVTVREGNPADRTDHTWREVNDFTKWFFSEMTVIEVGKAEVILQIGDENGPMVGELGYGEVAPNGTIQIRGASTSTADQKSYKIELRDRAGLWRGQSTIALNKHPYDITRIKNKLSFDLLRDIPDLVSLRTQFVRLFIKDETSDPPSEKFVDYGLFTQVEQPNTRFLRNHLLDPAGQFYKTTFFEFFTYEDKLKLADSPTYDEDSFSSILEIKGDQDHSKLIKMLEDVNNWSIPINEVLEYHFNEDNYFTWLAFNILVGNVDTQTQNFYLYSPKNSHTWYFLPWDYDGAWTRLGRTELGKQEHTDFSYGISNYWGVILHKRVLRVDRYREKLDNKIHEVMAQLSPEKIQGYLDTYRATTEELIFQVPDIYYLPGDIREYELAYDLIIQEVQANYELYLESLESPMPFFLGTPRQEEDQLIFGWDQSFDFDAEDISYHFILSKDWNFNEIVFETEILNISEIIIDMPEQGTYFWRVIATNESGYSQFPFDAYKDAERRRHSGMKYLSITAEGEVLEE